MMSPLAGSGTIHETLIDSEVRGSAITPLGADGATERERGREVKRGCTAGVCVIVHMQEQLTGAFCFEHGRFCTHTYQPEVL